MRVRGRCANAEVGRDVPIHIGYGPYTYPPTIALSGVQLEFDTLRERYESPCAPRCGPVVQVTPSRRALHDDETFTAVITGPLTMTVMDSGRSMLICACAKLNLYEAASPAAGIIVNVGEGVGRARARGRLLGVRRRQWRRFAGRGRRGDAGPPGSPPAALLPRRWTEQRAAGLGWTPRVIV